MAAAVSISSRRFAPIGGAVMRCAVSKCWQTRLAAVLAAVAFLVSQANAQYPAPTPLPLPQPAVQYGSGVNPAGPYQPAPYQAGPYAPQQLAPIPQAAPAG